MWIDTHCHLDFICEDKLQDGSLFDNSLLDLIICPSANHKSFNILKKLNQKDKSIVYAFGYHPLYLCDIPKNPIHYLENEVLNSKPIAIGEIGLDFYLGNEDKEKQKIMFKQQLKLFNYVSEIGHRPLVIDSFDIRKDPRSALECLCNEVGLDFIPDMLSWPKGGHKSDGVWAKHWYGAVHLSEGFSEEEKGLPSLDVLQRDISRKALPFYYALEENKLKF